MGKLFTLLFLLFVFHPTAAPTSPSQEHQKQGTRERAGAVPAPSQVTGGARTTARDEQAPKWYSPVWAEWGLVAVGLLTLLAVWKQSRETRRAADKTAESVDEIHDQTGVLERQTKSIHHQAVQVRKQTAILGKSADAARMAAEATLRSVETATGAERAYLLVDGFVDPPKLPRHRQNPVQIEEFAVRIKNYGKTPGFLAEWVCKTYVTKTDAIMSGAPPYGDLNTARRPAPFPPDMGENFFAEWKIENPSEIDDVAKGKRHLYVYGAVKYRTIFGQKLLGTYFCFHYSRNRNAAGQLEEAWSAEPQEANWCD